MTSEAHFRAPMHALRIALGIVLTGQFFENIASGNFTASGFRRLANSFADRTTAPSIWVDIMRSLGDRGAILGPIQAASEVAIAIALLTGVAWGFAAAGFAAILASLALSELGIYWPWELPPLIAIAICVGIAGIVEARRHGMLVRPDAGGILRSRSVALVAAGAVLVGAGVAGFLAASAQPESIWMRTGIAVAALLLVHVALDRRRGQSRSDVSPAA